MFIGLGMPLTRPGGTAGESLGPELVVNGDMDGDTGWGFTIVDGSEPTMAGAMVFDGTSDVIVDGTLTGIPTDGNYRATWTEGSLASDILVGGTFLGGGAGGIVTTAAGAGSADFAVVDATSAAFGFRSEYTVGTLDGLSIKQIL